MLWQARASLVVTDPTGGHIDLPDNVRVYLLSGTQHGGGPGVHTRTPSQGMCQNLSNPLALAQTRAALSVALYEWVANGVEPPPSRFPTVAGGGLVSANELGFPDIPGVTYSGSYNPLHLADHRSLPPMYGDAYPVLVGRIDDDGNMVDGVRHPNLAAPVGTYTGWNLRRAGFGEGGAVRRDRLVHSVRGHGIRTCGFRRSACVARSALFRPRCVRPGGLRGGGRAGG